MIKKRFVVLVFLILVSSVYANSDFNNDGKVDFEDFFLLH